MAKRDAEAAALRQELQRAEAYGVDLSLISAELEKTPLQRLKENDEALAFFASIKVTPGWDEPARRYLVQSSSPKRRNKPKKRFK